MKVFFTSCLNRSSIGQTDRVAQIEDFLKTTGNKVYEYVYDQNRLDGTRRFGELSELILESDVYIAEMSVASQTLGFQIAFALNSTKPCLYLYHEETKGQPDAPLARHPSRLLKITSYNEDNVADKLSSFLDYAKKQLATKRTSFMSTQEVDHFLDSESSRLGVHKAELIRQILHEAAFGVILDADVQVGLFDISTKADVSITNCGGLDTAANQLRCFINEWKPSF